MSCCNCWLQESDSCLEQAQRFRPVHPVTTNAYSGQVLLVDSIGYQDGCCELGYNVELRVGRAAKSWVVALALCVVLQPINVHRARPLEARHAVGHHDQVVKPQVAHLQARDLNQYPRRCACWARFRAALQR